MTRRLAQLAFAAAGACATMAAAAEDREPRPTRHFVDQSAGGSWNQLGIQHVLGLRWTRPLSASRHVLLADSHVSGGVSHTLTPSYTRLTAWGALAPLSVVEIRAGVEPGLYFGTFGSLLSFPGYDSGFADDQRRERKSEAGAGTGLRLFAAPSLRLRAGSFAFSGTVSFESWRSSADGPCYYEPARDTLLRSAGDELVHVSAVLVRQLSRRGGGRLTYGLSYETTNVSGSANRSQRIGLVAVRRLASKHLGLPSPSLAARVGYYLSDPNRDGQLSLALGVSVEREH